MPKRRQVHADLVRPAGIEVTANECMRAAFFDDLIPRARKPAPGHDGHSLAILGMAADRSLELALVGFESAPCNRKVGAAEAAVAELRRKRPMRNIVASDDDQPGCPFVEPVDDARSRLSARCRPCAPAAQQRVHEGAGLMARRWMDDHARGFVDDHEVLILVDDLERDLLGRGRHFICLGDLQLDNVTNRHTVGRIRRFSVDAYEMTLDEARRSRPAEIARVLRDETVEPGRGGFRDQPAVGLRIR